VHGRTVTAAAITAALVRLCHMIGTGTGTAQRRRAMGRLGLVLGRTVTPQRRLPRIWYSGRTVTAAAFTAALVRAGDLHFRGGHRTDIYMQKNERLSKSLILW
jgi:hypothetical protein